MTTSWAPGMSGPQWSGPAPHVPPSGDQPFFKTLFSLGFTSFIATKVLGFVYLLAMIIIILGWIVTFMALYNLDGVAGTLALLLGAVVVVLLLTIVRTSLELTAAIIEIARNTREIAAKS